MPDKPFDIALFPLPIVILPGTAHALHIFEPRYKELIAHRMADDLPFAISLGDDEESADVGCAVYVAGVLRRLEDGRLDIVVRGRDRIRRIALADTMHPYAVIRAEDYEDIVPAEAALVDKTRSLFRRLAAAKGWPPNLAIDTEQNGGVLSWHVADALSLPVETRQELLDSNDAADRLNRLNALMAERI